MDNKLEFDGEEFFFKKGRYADNDNIYIGMVNKYDQRISDVSINVERLKNNEIILNCDFVELHPEIAELFKTKFCVLKPYEVVKVGRCLSVKLTLKDTSAFQDMYL